MNFNSYFSGLGYTFDSSLNEFLELIRTYLPNLFVGLSILIIGWLAALILSALVAGFVSKVKLDEALVKSLGEDSKTSKSVSNKVRSLTFYIIMLFVLILFFQSLELDIITEPLNNLSLQISSYLPRVLGAGVILIFGWMIASLVRNLVTTVLDKTKLDETLASKTGKKEGSIHLAHSISETIYWLILLLTIPIVLNALDLTNVLGPVNLMFSEFLGHLPNIFSAGVILFIGWFIARVVQRITTNLITSIGTDHLLETLGLKTIMGKSQLSEVVGLVVYVLILFPVLISALDALALDAIVLPATNMLNKIFGAFPLIFAALIMLTIAVFVGRLASSLVENLLNTVGFDKLIGMLGIKNKELPKGQASPSHIIAQLTMIAIILFASMEAFNMIGLNAISSLLQQFIVFAGQILMGIVILIAGLILANIAAQAIKSTVSSHANFLASIARTAILILAGSMGLKEMGFANDIIEITIAIFFGAIGVAIALAFGLGCRDIAAKQMTKWIESIK